ncbi:MAG: ethanolamine utilization protein EutJ [Arachnia sp.]
MDTDARINRLARQVRTGRVGRSTGELRLGLDLGTANIVMSVVDERGEPVAGSWRQSGVVRDGVVVDWVGAVRAVKDLRATLESRLECRFASASVAIPPGIDRGTIKVFANVVEAAGLEMAETVDEPVAAARTLGVTDGAVIDIGHGTTGVSVLESGRVVVSEDEATGGHHMTLVVAGALDISYDEAEMLKRDPGEHSQIFGLIRPTLEKMASIAARVLAGRQVPSIHLVGGSSSYVGAAELFAEELGQPVTRPDEPLFVTPLGIALPAQLPSEHVRIPR